MAETITAPPALEVFEPQKIAQLMVNSFRFSRGVETAQANILSFLTHTYTDSFSEAACEESKGIVYKAAHKRANAPNHRYGIGFGQVQRTVDTHYQDLTSSLDLARRKQKGEPPKDYSWLQPPAGDYIEATPEERLLASLINADAKWVHQYSNMSHEPGEQRDYRSNLLRYGVLAMSTSIPEYDAMFRSAAGTMREFIADENWDLIYEMSTLPEIVAAHLAFNPDDTAALAQAAPSY